MGRRTLLLLAVIITTLPGAAARAASGADAFEAAPLATVPLHAVIDTTAATLQDGEPVRPCAPVGATVWYRIEVAAWTNVVATTAGSDFDTVVALYRGTSLKDLELLACNDDFGSRASRAQIAAVPGMTYYLQAGGLGGESGTLVLNLISGGGVSGIVTDAAGAPLRGVCVTAYDGEGVKAGKATTGPAGGYRLRGLLPGPHHMHFAPCSDSWRLTGFAAAWWPAAASIEDAQPVAVARRSIARADMVLPSGGAIHGVVRGSDGSAGHCVTAYGLDGVFAKSAGSSAEGAYRIGGLSPGSYRVHLGECGGFGTVGELQQAKPGPYESVWYGGSSFATATTLDVDLDAVTRADGTLPVRPMPALRMESLVGEELAPDADGARRLRVTATMVNEGEQPADAYDWEVYACPVTMGRCPAFERRDGNPTIGTGERIELSTVLDVTTVAGDLRVWSWVYLAGPELNTDDNGAQVVVGRTGTGIGACGWNPVC